LQVGDFHFTRSGQDEIEFQFGDRLFGAFGIERNKHIAPIRSGADFGKRSVLGQGAAERAYVRLALCRKLVPGFEVACAVHILVAELAAERVEFCFDARVFHLPQRDTRGLRFGVFDEQCVSVLVAGFVDCRA
jgi:hypothetical protein